MIKVNNSSSEQKNPNMLKKGVKLCLKLISKDARVTPFTAFWLVYCQF